jgi:anti-sigma B factor antagonist
MDVKVFTVDQIQIVSLSGELDANTSPVAQLQILPLATEGARILLDMNGVTFMSSAGLRMLLTTYREAVARKAQVALARLSEDLAETMSETGFLSFFAVHDDVETGVQALKNQG